MRGVFLSLLIPWIIFCVVDAALCSSLRYNSVFLSGLLVSVVGLVVLGTIGLGFNAVRRRRVDPAYQPMWYIFLAITCLVAYLLAIEVGQLNWTTNTSQYFSSQHLNEYSNVDPALTRAQQVMDAGVIEFVQTSKVDLKYSMGFRNGVVYCVAPITAGDAPPASYDFWAVGRNCCSGSANDFMCGKYSSAVAHTGLRLMNTEDKEFYQLAVQQAEASFRIRSNHPLFFFWVEDAIAEKAQMVTAGMNDYFLGIVAHFFFQLFLVVITSIIFAKVGGVVG